MLLLRDLQPDDADWVLEQHAQHYRNVERFDATFETLVARLLDEFCQHRDSVEHKGWIAEDGNRQVGCVFYSRLDCETAKLRMFFVVQEVRGQGVGGCLLHALEGHARAQGHSRVRIWTHAEHSQACALYLKWGYRCVESYPVHSFGRNLTEQIWEKRL